MKISVKAMKMAVLVGGSVMAILLLTTCGSEEIKTPVVIGKSADVIELVDKYSEMKRLGLAGEVNAFLAHRDPTILVLIRELFASHNVEIDSTVISDWAITWTVVDDLDLVQDTISGEWRRLVFREGGYADDDGNPYIKYPVILYHLVDDDWMFSSASQVGSYQFDSEGKDITVKELVFHDLFKLPPVFPELGTGETKLPPEGLDNPVRKKGDITK
ncbi:MAG: hypothetical protein GY841_14380 [FCB group bacterium]|nr:hypothetical protein [FCB group bacterium]